MIGVWFKDENKTNGQVNGTHIDYNRLSRSERNALECQKFINGRLENAE